MKKKDTASDVKNLQGGIDNFAIKIEKLKTEQKDIRNINMIQEPQASLTPIGPNKKKNIVLAAILSLMVGTFLTFFMEFLEKSKRV